MVYRMAEPRLSVMVLVVHCRSAMPWAISDARPSLSAKPDASEAQCRPFGPSRGIWTALTVFSMFRRMTRVADGSAELSVIVLAKSSLCDTPNLSGQPFLPLTNMSLTPETQ